MGFEDLNIYRLLLVSSGESRRRMDLTGAKPSKAGGIETTWRSAIPMEDASFGDGRKSLRVLVHHYEDGVHHGSQLCGSSDTIWGCPYSDPPPAGAEMQRSRGQTGAGDAVDTVGANTPVAVPLAACACQCALGVVWQADPTGFSG